jgi:ATP:corrinoid adenosyltransferase
MIRPTAQTVYQWLDKALKTEFLAPMQRKDYQDFAKNLSTTQKLWQQSFQTGKVADYENLTREICDQLLSKAPVFMKDVDQMKQALAARRDVTPVTLEQWKRKGTELASLVTELKKLEGFKEGVALH